MRIHDPWYDTLASGWGERHDEPTVPMAAVPAPVRPGAGADGACARAAARTTACLAVHRSAAFQEVRRRHRRFVLSAGTVFLAWQLAYAAAVAAAPGLLGRPLGGGPFTVGALAGLAQLAAVSLLARAYARHARLHRDRTAFELRWHIQDLARTAGGADSAGCAGCGERAGGPGCAAQGGPAR